MAYLVPEGSVVMCSCCRECNPDCFVLNKVGQTFVSATDDVVRNKAEELLREHLSDKHRNNRLVSYCWLCTATKVNPRTADIIKAFESDPANREDIETCRKKIRARRTSLEDIS